MTTEGIDTSAAIEVWPAWNLAFGMAKATEGTGYREPAFPANWASMGECGPTFPRFAYHYFHPWLDPVEQAAYCYEYVREQGIRQHDHFVLDLETSDGQSPIEVSFAAYVFCREINRISGHRVMVYTFPWFAEQGYTSLLGDWALWIAHWGVPRPQVPPPWRNWVMWQYAAGGNIDHDRYQGTPQQLTEWTSHAG